MTIQATIEHLEEHIRGLKIAQETAGSHDEWRYIQNIIDGYRADIEQLQKVVED